MRASPLIASLLGLTLLGAGCLPAGRQAPLSSTPGTAGSIARDGCAHDYFPVRDGYRVAYRINSTVGPKNYVMTVTNASPNRFTASYTFEGNPANITQDISCNNGEFKAEGMFDFSGAAGADAQMTSKTSNVSGIFLPRDMVVGTTWTSSWDSQVTFNIPGAAELFGDDRTARLSLTAEREVVAEEPVTVAAGTFTALKVEVRQTSGAATIGRMTLPEKTSVTTEWWVRDVGLVKTTGDFGDIEATEVAR